MLNAGAACTAGNAILPGEGTLLFSLHIYQVVSCSPSPVSPTPILPTSDQKVVFHLEMRFGHKKWHIILGEKGVDKQVPIPSNRHENTTAVLTYTVGILETKDALSLVHGYTLLYTEYVAVEIGTGATGET